MTVTPPDADGNWLVIVIVNLFSKYVALYPASKHDATTLATALFQYFCTYGLCDLIVSDPGSDLMSEVVNSLHTWFGIRHRFSLIARHQSNGVEGSNKIILKHLRAMVFDERIANQWSKPTVLPLIQFMMNCEDVSSESGIVPLHAHFGNIDDIYHRLPSDTQIPLIQNLFVRTLADNLKAVRSASALFKRELAQTRSAETPALQQNSFKPGDFVLKRQIPRPSKLYFEYLRPFLVLSQVKNDVQVRNLVYDSIHTFFVEDLKLFHGTLDQAVDAARRDTDQFAIESVVMYRGDPLQRTTTSFLVHFADGDKVWLPWSMDISSTQAFETFCLSRSELYLLLYSAKEAKRIYAAINKQPITEVKPGDVAYVDLRWYGYDWYSGLGLPNHDTLST